MEKSHAYSNEILKRAHSLDSEETMGTLIDLLKDKKVVMLGEASHGTHEFYEWRRKISLELLRHHGFSFIAVEGDWPPCEIINDSLKAGNDLSPHEILKTFNRWPTWMWANSDVAELIIDLREINSQERRRIGFHGLDVYSLFESIDEVIRKLEMVDPMLAERARQHYSCLEPFRQDEIEYVRSLFSSPESCEKDVTQVLQETLDQRLKGIWQKDEALFDAIQNAKVVKNAERYYRAMALSQDDSWNIRDNHMMDTLDMLLNHYGPGAKGIVWEHNTHIGDYRATDMLIQGHVNIGGLARARYGTDEVALVGFSTYQGSVIASHVWDGPIEEVKVPPAKAGSLEDICHELVENLGANFFVPLEKDSRKSDLNQFKLHRAIGVIYSAESEHRSNYVPTRLASRYDALIFLDQTTALKPYRVMHDPHKFPETYPYSSDL
jgi:erythromycin esterase-like protein